MAKVHEFLPVSFVDADMRLPLQYLGPSNFQERSIPLLELLAWIEANIELPVKETITLSASGSFAVPPGKWALWVALESATAQTGISIGETPGGNELGFDVSVNGMARVQLGVYGGAAGTNIYFAGLTATTTISILVI
jgi:hypothetical protein